MKKQMSKETKSTNKRNQNMPKKPTKHKSQNKPKKKNTYENKQNTQIKTKPKHTKQSQAAKLSLFDTADLRRVDDATPPKQEKDKIDKQRRIDIFWWVWKQSDLIFQWCLMNSSDFRVFLY